MKCNFRQTDQPTDIRIDGLKEKFHLKKSANNHLKLAAKDACSRPLLMIIELEDKNWTQSWNLNDTKLKSVLQYAPSCHTHDFFPHWFFVGVIPAFLKSFSTVLHHPVVDLAIKIICLLFVSKEAKILRFDLVCLLGKGHKFIQPSLGNFLEEATISPEISIVCIKKSLHQ